MSVKMSNGNLIHVSALNQYLYCPRRLWYYRFYAPEDYSPELVEGQAIHQRQSRQTDQFRDQYFAAPSVGLHGRVDLIEASQTGADNLTPVERKRASGKQYYWNDEVQLAGYCMLIEATLPAGQSVDQGYIYLYSTDQRHLIEISEDHRTAVKETINAIQSLEPGTPPDIVDNPNKCEACSIRHRCRPTTVTRLSDTESSNTSSNVVDTR